MIEIIFYDHPELKIPVGAQFTVSTEEETTLYSVSKVEPFRNNFADDCLRVICKVENVTA